MMFLGLVVIALGIAVMLAALGSATERKVTEADLFLARLRSTTTNRGNLR